MYIFRGYENPPRPSAQRLHEASRQIYQGILSVLKSKSRNPIYIIMDLDIWRYVSHGKGKASQHKGFKLFALDDLSRLPLPDQWWYWLNVHSEGQAILPPLKIKPVLSWTAKKHVFKDNKLSQAPQVPIEKLCLDLLKHPCNVNNL